MNPKTENDRLEAFEQHRGLLFSIAYRMLGSVADAEDMLQEAFIRWRGVDGGEIQSPRALLVTIVSRLCINHLQSARVKREQYFGEWLPEPLLTEPAADGASAVDDSLSIAFLMLLERLTAVERAVFLLREVFDYDYAEIAHILSLTEANCRQILSRARRHVADVRPRFDPSPERREQLLHEFVDASTRGNMKGLLRLLADDVVLHSDGGGKAAAVPKSIRGAERVARLVFGALRKFVPPDVVRRVVQINGQPGIVNYHRGAPQSVLTMDVRGGRIRAIYIVSNPEKLERLPLLQ